MATFRASFSVVLGRAATGATMPVIHLPTAVRLTDLTTSGASQIVQHDGADFAADKPGFVTLHCDGDVNVAAGAAPVAGADTGIFVPAGVTRDISINTGDKIAVAGA